MRTFQLPRCFAIGATFLVTTVAFIAAAGAADIVQLSEDSWDGVIPRGKEVDCIYGDWVLRNDHLVAVIAEAIPSRNANMTVRGVGGCVIDLTKRDRPSDQLSAYYPLGGRYKLSGPVLSDESADGDGVSLRFAGPAADDNSKAEVIYSLDDDARWLKITTRVTNTSDQPLEWKPIDAIRADGEFEFGLDDDLGLFWAYDRYWRQAYGALVMDQPWRLAADKLERRARPNLRFEPVGKEAPRLAPGETGQIVRYLFPAAHTIEAKALARELHGEKLATVSLAVNDPDGPIDGADVELNSADGKAVAHGRTDSAGRLQARLPLGNYQANVSAQGRDEKQLDWKVSKDAEESVRLAAPGYIVAKITGQKGQPTPCKVQFSGQGDTADPNFGPDSAVHGVRNAYYTADGTFRVPLAPGEYDVIISYGPEFDAVFTSVQVTRGKETPLTAQLTRSVDTPGWISADFHSHSTPSGDNTSSQRGRVLNLLAEHIEFAPCTEHNRLTVYDPHLAHFKAERLMLTCPGMELTGSPGSINHQNAFPLVPHPHTQDGGAPLTDSDPVVQIERLAMWDGGSDKLVQINHPNIAQMVGDRDLDGSPDGGFEKMFSFMDVIEVHPLDRIFETPESLPSARERGSAVFHWLQLTNLGYRLPGVVNTDAHWNFHGSGGKRNYIKSSTDDPTKADVADLVHACEHGNIVMSNGPYLEVSAKSDKVAKPVNVGDDLEAPDGAVQLKVRVQCPNWLEVNRVQVFVNGRAKPEWNFTQRTHPKMFRQETVAFDESISLQLDSDAHLVVACAGEGKKLGPVTGPQTGERMPVAVGNPIFVDVDGGGFKPNGDMLGLPLPVEPGLKPSKPHRHPH